MHGNKVPKKTSLLVACEPRLFDHFVKSMDSMAQSLVTLGLILFVKLLWMVLLRQFISLLLIGRLPSLSKIYLRALRTFHQPPLTNFLVVIGVI
jgi:hypothetical protein